MSMRTGCSILFTMMVGTVVCATVARAADTPPVKTTMAYKPIHADVEYDIPDAAAQAACKVAVAREGKQSGWVVTGPSGQTLRRFMDTNGDNVVDQWSYFRNGIEVYRDIDSNNNNKVDQSRWLNIGGARWGVDSNEDGKIDTWKRISAEEVSRLAVKALMVQDAALIAPLLMSAEDLRALGVSGSLETKILEAVSDPAGKLKAASKNSKLVGPKTVFLRFDGAAPGVIPADQLKTPQDITVYENAMAIVDPGATGKPGLIQIGEMVRIGEVWKLTSLPIPLEGEEIEIAFGLLVSPENAGSGMPATVAATGISEEAKALVDELGKLDKAAPAPDASKAEHVRHNMRRSDLLAKLRKLATTDELKEQWLRQEADGVAAGVQTETFPDGVARLKALEAEVVKNSPKSTVAAYVVYRRMLAEYSIEIQSASNEERTKIQERWLKQLETFVNDSPKAEDAADACLQLAIAQEFAGKLDEAKKWYTRITKDFPESAANMKAVGAMRRIELAGKPLELTGPDLFGKAPIDVKQFKGRTVLVLFWSTWCKPCTEDLPQIKALYEKYHSRGFEIVGVNVDSEKAAALPYLKQYQVTWPQIYADGGLEGDLARSFGVISLPTMFIVNPEGKVTNRSASVVDLKAVLEPEKK